MSTKEAGVAPVDEPVDEPVAGPVTGPLPDAQAQERGFGGFRLGGMQLALPMAALREVVACGELVRLPTANGCVVGGINLRGVLVPVLDLQRLLGSDHEQARWPSVIIVVHDNRIMGLLADGVTGVFDCTAGSFRRVHVADARAAVYAGSIRRADDGALVSVLSPEALAALPDIPWIEDPEPQRGQQQALLTTNPGAAGDGPVASSEAGGPALPRSRPVMLLRCGTTLLAIDAMAVHATVAVPVLERSVLAVGACRGVLPFSGLRVPMVDLMALTGLGQLQADGGWQAIVLATERGLAGLLVDAVVDVVATQANDVVPVPSFALPEPTLFAGALHLKQGANAVGHATAHQRAGQYLMLDGDALKRCETLVALATAGSGTVPANASANRNANANASTAAPVAGALAGLAAKAATSSMARAMITFVLVDEVAVPLDQVAEILPYRPEMASSAPRGALVGIVVDRGRTIPVLCLRQLAGAPPLAPTADTSVLVVQVGQDRVGFAVPRLRSIETTRWEPSLPPQGMGAQDMLTHALRSRQMALLTGDTGDRMLRVVELAQVAQALCAGQLAA